MNKHITFFIDFDSTMVQVESLDLLADIVLQNHPKKDLLVATIEEITRQGMEGKISFEESLRRRMELFSPTKYHIKLLVEKLQEKITTSFLKRQPFFSRHADSIYILSSGFREYIVPIAARLGISASHVIGNRFLADINGTIIGYDKAHPLAKEKGKVNVLKNLHKDNLWYMIGDGYTDYQTREEGLVDTFVVFTENITREMLLPKADAVAKNFDEVLWHL